MDVVYESPTFSVAVVGSVVCTSARSSLEAEHVDALDRAYQQCGARCAGITHVQTDRPGASAEARAALNVFGKKYKNVDAGTVVVMNGGGFAASVVRAIIGGLLLMAGGNVRIFTDLDEGIRWLAGVAGDAKLASFDAVAVKRALLQMSDAQAATATAVTASTSGPMRRTPGRPRP